MYSPSFISSNLFEYIVENTYKLILDEQINIYEINANLIDFLVPDFYEEWDQLTEEQVDDVIYCVQNQLRELFEDT